MTGRYVPASYKLIMGTEPQAYAVPRAAPTGFEFAQLVSGVKVTVLPFIVIVAFTQSPLEVCTAAHAHVPGPALSCAAQSNSGSGVIAPGERSEPLK